MTQHVTTSNGELLFLPLGGAGEIGMNLNLYGFRGKWIMVDCGITFADGSMPGVDIVLPDPEFIERESANLLGLLLTHAHEDHIGAVAYLWPRLKCPVYATPFTSALVASKLKEAGILKEVPLNIVPLSGSVTLGEFDVRYIPITHSIPEAHSLCLRTPVGTVLHTGDWKLDPKPVVGNPTDPDPFRTLGDEGVMALVCDSTNVFRTGSSGSEQSVRESLEKIVSQATGRVAITTFASNVARIKSILAIAEASDRHAVLVGRSIWRTVQAACATGHLDAATELLRDVDAGYLPPEKVLLVCTGCQGEPRGAMSRIAFGDHPQIALQADDLVIFSSKIIPGNERSIDRVQNQLTTGGVQIITEKDHFVHTSGHPSRDELAEMYAWTRPKIAVPVHGEARHLQEHGRLALELGAKNSIVVRNGDLLRLHPGPEEIVNRVPVGRLALDGRKLVAEDSGNLQMRRRLMLNGLIAVTIILNDKGVLELPPRVLLRGVPGTEGSDFEAAVCQQMEEDIRALPSSKRGDVDAIDNAVRRAARRLLKPLTFGRPPIEVDVIRMPANTTENFAYSLGANKS